MGSWSTGSPSIRLDESLGRAAVSLFRSDGYDTQTVRAQGLSGAGDREVIAACRSGRRCLVTLDPDLANPLLFDPAVRPGVAVIHLPARPSHQDLPDTCKTPIAGLVKADIVGRLRIIQRGRTREYQPEDRT